MPLNDLQIYAAIGEVRGRSARKLHATRADGGARMRGTQVSIRQALAVKGLLTDGALAARASAAANIRHVAEEIAPYDSLDGGMSPDDIAEEIATMINVRDTLKSDLAAAQYLAAEVLATAADAEAATSCIDDLAGEIESAIEACNNLINAAIASRKPA